MNKSDEARPGEPLFYDGDVTIIASQYLSKRLAKRRYLVEMDSRKLLASPGDEIDTCYFIAEGLLISYEYVDRHRRIYDYYEKGEFVFAEHAIWDKKCHLYYEALTPMKMYSIRMEFTRKLLINDNKFSNAILAQMTKNYLVTQDFLRKTALHSARWRVCDLLLIFAEKVGFVDGCSAVLNQKLTKTLLSDFLHLNRITIMRELQFLEELGICRLHGTQCTLYDLSVLQEYRDSLE